MVQQMRAKQQSDHGAVKVKVKDNLLEYSISPDEHMMRHDVLVNACMSEK